MPIKKFNAAENERRKEENCKSLSKQGKEVAPESQEYLELKDGQKIGILNGVYLEENLSNQMTTSIQKWSETNWSPF